MFAITFDLIIAEVKVHHPKAVNRAYEEVRRTLAKNGFVWKQGSVYINPDGGLVELFSAINDLKALPRFPASVRELRAFRMENNSEFSSHIRE
jgi:virulence-associated protein VapD